MNSFNFDSIIPNLKSTNSKQVLKELADHTSRLIGTPTEFLLGSLLEQEHNESSGIGHGVAIPHMRLPRLTRPMIVFAKLTHLVDFKAIDKDPVDLVCLVLSPEYEGPRHLSRLSKVSRYFSDENFCAQLRGAKDADDVRIILKDINTRKMAA